VFRLCLNHNLSNINKEMQSIFDEEDKTADITLSKLSSDILNLNISELNVIHDGVLSMLSEGELVA
jgi:hypothetical protein